MPAHYDKYDYESYWKERDYEHRSEALAIKSLLQKVPKITKIVDIGSGYGRLVPFYLYRVKRAVLSDPSAKNLKIARKKFGDKNIKYLHSKVENLSKRVYKSSFDMVLLVRVLHHIENVDLAFGIVSRILKDKGYLLLEFPNKCHWKATVSEFFKGNFVYIFDVSPKDARSNKSKSNKSIPFKNYHPDMIQEMLRKNGFEILERRSVSNVRSRRIKSKVNADSLMGVEKFLQKPLARLNFGPSIFILAQKVG